jgi:hypothetical protein
MISIDSASRLEQDAEVGAAPARLADGDGDPRRARHLADRMEVVHEHRVLHPHGLQRLERLGDLDRLRPAP